ncbi:MAG TPA: biotin transporter BioY [Jiangellales bacterium]|nr:biotin transporter BioY [Jiangellales bacterium]
MTGRRHRPAPLAARDLARIAVFAALIAVLGLPGTVLLFGGAVPVTAQTLGVMLAGAVLGARRGFLAALTFCVLVLAGLPLLAGGRGGLGVLAGPSAGYFLAFPLAALVVGLLVQRRLPRVTIGWTFVACVVGGIGVLYAVGVPVLAWRADLDLRAALLTGALVFLPGDLLKAAVAAAVATGVHRAYPALAEERLATERG